MALHIKGISATRWLVLGGVAVCLVCGCGDDRSPRWDDSSAGAFRTLDVSTAFPNSVTSRDLSRTVARSPERAILEWFQAVQFQDLLGVRRLTAQRALRSAGRTMLARAVATVGPALGKPNVDAIHSRGADASIRVAIEAYLPGRSEPRSVEPVRFRVVREAGDWRLSSLDYLLTAASRMRAAGLAPAP
jgi:hypothetical protein